MLTQYEILRRLPGNSLNLFQSMFVISRSLWSNTQFGKMPVNRYANAHLNRRQPDRLVSKTGEWEDREETGPMVL